MVSRRPVASNQEWGPSSQRTEDYKTREHPHRSTWIAAVALVLGLAAVGYLVVKDPVFLTTLAAKGQEPVGVTLAAKLASTDPADYPEPKGVRNPYFKPAPKVKAVRAVSSWRVSNAGSTDWDGVYEQAGTYYSGDHPYWQLDATHFLLQAPAGGIFFLASRLPVGAPIDDPTWAYAYRGGGGGLPSGGAWTTAGGLGTLPAPTVTIDLFTADTPTFITFRRDKQVTLDEALKVKFTFHYTGASAPATSCTWKLFIGGVQGATATILATDWRGSTGAYYVNLEHDFAVAAYGAGSHAITTQLLDNTSTDVADSAAATAIIVTPVYQAGTGAAPYTGGGSMAFVYEPGGYFAAGWASAPRTYPFAPPIDGNGYVDVVVHPLLTQHSTGYPGASFFVLGADGTTEAPLSDIAGTSGITSHGTDGWDPSVNYGTWETNSGTPVDNGPDAGDPRQQYFEGSYELAPAASAVVWTTGGDGSKTGTFATKVRLRATSGIWSGSAHSAGDLLAEADISFPLYMAAPIPVPPPWPPPSGQFAVTINAPTNGAQVSGAVSVVAAVAGGTAPFSIVATWGAVGLGTLVAANFGTSYRWANYNTLSVPDGLYTITVVATDANGQTATASIQVRIANTGPGDTTAPTVTIDSPANAANVAGTTPIVVSATDDVALASIMLYIDGALVGTAAVSGLSDSATFQVDTTAAMNGAHNVTAWAFDAAGNSAYATVGLVYVNGLADTSLVFFTKKIPDDLDPEDAAKWRMPDATPLEAMISLRLAAPTSDPRTCYNVLAAWNSPGVSRDFADYILATPGRAFGVPSSMKSWSVAVKFTPQAAWGTWNVGGTAVRNLLSDGKGGVYAVVWPAAIYKLVSGDWVLLASATPDGGETYCSSAIADGKVWLAGSVNTWVFDPDTNDLSYTVGLAATMTAFATTGTTVIMWGGGNLYTYTWPSMKLLGAADYDVTCVTAATTGYLLGTSNGHVISGTPGAWVDTTLPGATGAIHAISQLGGVWFAFGVDGVWEYNGTTWAHTVVGTDFEGGAAALTYLWGGGAGSGNLWRRTASGWAIVDTLAAVTNVYTALEFTATDGTKSLLVGVAGTSVGQVFALQFDEGSLVSGPSAPLIAPQILRYVSTSGGS